MGTPGPLSALQPRRHPTGTRHSMAASDLVQELHSIGDRLLLKLQRLPQAEPVEILAFSVLVVFTGKPGLFLASGRGNRGASRRAGWSPRQRRRNRCL